MRCFLHFDPAGFQDLEFGWREDLQLQWCCLNESPAGLLLLQIWNPPELESEGEYFKVCIVVSMSPL